MQNFSVFREVSIRGKTQAFNNEQMRYRVSVIESALSSSMLIKLQ